MKRRNPEPQRALVDDVALNVGEATIAPCGDITHHPACAHRGLGYVLEEAQAFAETQFLWGELARLRAQAFAIGVLNAE